MPRLVTLAKIGSTAQSYALQDGATVGDVLDAAGVMLAEGESLQINGDTVSKANPVRDGDKVYIIPSASGGH